jgi:hypothetical protein
MNNAAVLAALLRFPAILSDRKEQCGRPGRTLQQKSGFEDALREHAGAACAFRHDAPPPVRAALKIVIV